MTWVFSSLGNRAPLMRSIEGKNPEPRAKYIRTSVSGIWNKPSNLNNVETWANVPQIINNGADWYAGIGTERSKGTKLLSLGGRYTEHGDCGSSLRHHPQGNYLRYRCVVYETARGFKAVHCGGPMGGAVPEQYLDTPLDFDEMKKNRRPHRRRRCAGIG